MYGIITQDKSGILCRSFTIPDVYVIKNKDRARYPLLVESSIEIDRLLQEFTYRLDRYDLITCKYSEEELAEFIIRRLAGEPTFRN